MKDIPVFDTPYGVASLFLREIPYRGRAYIKIQSALEPEKLLEENRERCVRIPMTGDARSLNLSNSAAIVVYEALRQMEFPGMETAGKMKEATL